MAKQNPRPTTMPAALAGCRVCRCPWALVETNLSGYFGGGLRAVWKLYGKLPTLQATQLQRALIQGLRFRGTVGEFLLAEVHYLVDSAV